MSNDVLNDPEMQARLADTLFQKYYKYKGLEWGGEKVLGGILGDKEKDLERKSRLLDIMSKQHELGLPMDDSDYEDSVNKGRPFMSILGISAGRQIVDKIPQPGLLEHKTEPLRAIFKFAHSVEDELPSIVKNITKSQSGNKYGSVGRFFR